QIPKPCWPTGAMTATASAFIADIYADMTGFRKLILPCEPPQSEFWDITADRCRYWKYLPMPQEAMVAQKHA
ncbi:MAG: hypothetical protein ABF876_18435, partial [Acetobacter aceti]